MVGPEAIVQQVWQQVVPTDWKILRGRRRSAFAVGIRAAAWTCAALVLLTLAAVVLRAASAGRPAPLADVPATFAGYPTLAVVGAAVAALALLVGLTVVITVAIRNAGDHDPLIVLLPQGFVEYANRRQPTIGVLYPALASVEYKGQNARRQRGRQWLTLFFKDGRKERWRPRADFGPPERLFEAITKAHVLYHVLHDGGQ